jgi:hypothetical protein
VPVITAGDLQMKGISDIERLLQDAEEVMISVRGKARYVVMDIAGYDFLRECKIAAALPRSQQERLRYEVSVRTLSEINQLADWRYELEDQPAPDARILTRFANTRRNRVSLRC